MDYEALRNGFQAAIPYNNHVGLEVLEVAEGKAVVKLPESDNLKNHVGSQHAGALFSAGEAASGGAFIGAFAEHMGGITPLARSADIEYLKLARGDIRATGTLTRPADELIAKLDSDGRVEFPVTVELEDDEGNTVARMTVHWHVRRNA
jgi:acyl-coenzyme A thioesterase PaaI-like protein